jgi:hypothetical protein
MPSLEVAAVALLTAVLQASAVIGLLYTAVIGTTALAGVFARTPARRRAARDVLTILVLRSKIDR